MKPLLPWHLWATEQGKVTKENLPFDLLQVDSDGKMTLLPNVVCKTNAQDLLRHATVFALASLRRILLNPFAGYGGTELSAHSLPDVASMFCKLVPPVYTPRGMHQIVGVVISGEGRFEGIKPPLLSTELEKHQHRSQ